MQMVQDLWYNHSDKQLEDYHHPSCVPWDIRHFFDHHHWPNVKKLFPYRKHGGSKHSRYNVIAKSSLKDRDIEEVLNFLGAEYDRTVELATLNDISANKKSSMGQIRALIAKEMFEEEHRNEKQQGFHFPLGSKLQRTLSLHHFEPSDDWLAQKPIIFTHNIADPSLTEPRDVSHSSTPKNLVTCAKGSETLDNQEINKDVLEHHSDEYVDVLEVFKVNKKLFREIARDPDPMDRKLDRIYSLQNAKSRRLTKFNSFPMADNSSPSRKFMHGEHQKNETRPCPKVESLLHGTRSPKLLASKSSVADTKAVRVVKLERCSSSPNSTNELNNDRRFRRVSSLSNSMDRYSQLIEHRFSRDNKFHQSKSIKLVYEDGYISSGRDLNLASHSTIQNDVNQDLSYGKDEPELVALPLTTEKYLPVNASVVETRCQESYLIEEIDSCSTIEYASEVTTGPMNDEGSDGSDEQSKYAVELSVDKNIANSKEDNAITRTSGSKIAKGDLKFMDDAICIAESQTSGGTELKASCIKSDDLNELNSLNASEYNEYEKIDEKTREPFENYFSSNELVEENKANFSYISNVLQKSGISLKQPLSNELCGYEVVDNWDDQLLYDLVNEILLDMNEKSYAYWPTLLSHVCRIYPMPSEQRLLQEVRKIISNYLSLISEQDPSFDIAMSQDLAKEDSWMNLQYDTEIVALEIEDTIFDDLLDEILFSSDKF